LELPAELVATTVKVYAVPLVRPETTIGDAEPVPVSDPGLEVTVYPVMVEPLLDPGVNETLTCPDVPVAIAVTDVGAEGSVAFAIYVNGIASFRLPELVGVRVIEPATVGVMVKV
jgi:hypothetical protein